MFTPLRKNGPSLMVKIHTDGQVVAKLSDSSTYRERFLLRMLKTACDENKFPVMKPGQYTFNVAGKGLFKNQFELNRIED